ncbi:MAG: cysteine synthase family protein [Bacteroidota bacterium]
MSTLHHIDLWQHKLPTVRNNGRRRKLESLVSDSHSILASIGNTPLLRMRNVRPGNAAVEIYAKAEWFNPGGSVKDRPALSMLLEAERTGRLTTEKTIIDATSGNTGIAYAMIASALGYRVKLALPSNTSEERKRILRAYGAELILTDPLQGTDGAQRIVREIVEENSGRYFYPDQYNNPANWEAHYRTTAKEIWQQTQGRITHFVAGIGTSGTFVGNARRLREFDRSIRCISFEPDSPLHGLEGLKHLPTAIVPGIFDTTLANEHTTVSTDEAFAMARRLAREEGLFVGSSSGAALAVCLALAEELNSGVIVTVFPDGGMKYANEQYWNV